MSSPVNLVETTLRDGSYEIDHQWTTADTACLVSALDRAGVTYIECAHGSGIGSVDWHNEYLPTPRPAVTDREHMEAACAAAERAKIGVLYCAGSDMTPPDHLPELARIGVKFVRLAYFPGNIAGDFDLSYIQRAHDLGLLVSVNLMKSYAMSASQVASASKECARRGASWFYVVDSAGGMRATEVRDYVRAVREASDIRVGLHAHNNMGLALANSLAAVEAGATLVDGTLQGIGRATGNAPTEQLLLALQREGHERDVDFDAVLRLGRTARCLFAEKGNNPDFYASGAATLHSRSAKELFGLAKERNVSEAQLLLAVGRICRERDLLGKEVFPPEVLDEALSKLQPKRSFSVSAGAVRVVADNLERTRTGGITAAADLLFARSRKNRLTSVLHLVDAKAFPHEAPVFWQHGGLVGASLPLAIDAPITKLVADRSPDVLLVDSALAHKQDLPSAKHRFVASFKAVVADAVAELIAQLGADKPIEAMLPRSDSTLSDRVRMGLEARGVTVAAGKRKLLVRHAAELDAAELEGLSEGDFLVVVGGRADLRTWTDIARRRGVHALRPPIWQAVAASVVLSLSARARLAKPLTPSVLAPKLRAVDPFVCESIGETVVDSLDLPTCVISPADSEAVVEVATVRAGKLASGLGDL